jgi:hypothetical protein
MKDEPSQEPARPFYRSLKAMRRGIKQLQLALRSLEALRPDELTQAQRFERVLKIRYLRRVVCKQLAGHDQLKSQLDELFEGGGK